MHYKSMVTIMIATFNSEKLLPRTLDAIKMQTYPAELIEILIIDGGSGDRTRKIAEEYGCLIIDNPKTEPINAKLIGMKAARGKYLVTIDHDEVMQNDHSIENKVIMLERHPECKVALCSGYLRPDDYPWLNQYISEFGDPFSLFIYRFSKGFGIFEKNLRRYYHVEADETEGFVVSFESIKKQPIFELCCMGTMIDREYFMSFDGVCNDSSIFVHLFYIMLQDGKNKVAFTVKDPLTHYSADSLKKYFPKIKWRICNNVHFADMAKSGYGGRIYFGKSIKYRKYLFVPYTFLCIPAIVEGFYLAISRHNPIFMMHPIFCWYTLIEIVYQYILKITGRSPVMISYDGKKVV